MSWLLSFWKRRLVRPTFLKPKLSIEEMFDRLALHSEKIPELPDYAFTRESFYEDHD